MPVDQAPFLCHPKLVMAHSNSNENHHNIPQPSAAFSFKISGLHGRRKGLGMETRGHQQTADGKPQTAPAKTSPIKDVQDWKEGQPASPALFQTK